MFLSVRQSKAFTLLELIVVIVILGILAAIAVVSFQKVIEKSQNASTSETLQAVDREARALAAFRGESTPTSDDYAEAAADLPASALLPDVYAASSWKVRVPNTAPPAASHDNVVLYDPAAPPVLAVGEMSLYYSGETVGLAAVSESGDCILLSSSGGSVEVFDRDALGANCNGSTAVAGPSAEDPGYSSGAPATPVNVVATPGNAQVSLTWDAVQGASSYRVYLGSSTSPAVEVTAATATVGGLTNGTSYSFTVTAVKSGSQSAPSAPVQATPSVAVVFAVRDSNAVDAQTETPFVNRLRTNGYGVTVIDDSEIATRNHAGASMIVVSVDADFPAAAKDLPYPIITMDGRDATTFGHAGTQTYARYGGFHTATTTTVAHPIKDTLTGDVKVYSVAGDAAVAYGLIAPARMVASLQGNRDFATVYTVEEGPRRALFGYHQGSLLNADAWAMFDRTAAWSVSNVPTAPVISTSTTGDSIQVTVPSFVPEGSVDLRYRKHGVTEWTTVSNMTSPHTLTGFPENTTYELQAQKTNSSGTSPWSTAKFATTSITQQALNGKTVAFAVLDSASPHAVTEKPFVDRLRLLGYTVQVFDDAEIATRNHTGASMIFVSVDADFPASAKDLPYPILTMDGRDATTFGNAGTQTYARYGGFHTTTTTTLAHPIKDTLTGDVRVYTAAGDAAVAYGLLAPARMVGSLQGNRDFATVYTVDEGPRRALFGYHQANLLMGDAWAMFDRTAAWSASSAANTPVLAVSSTTADSAQVTVPSFVPEGSVDLRYRKHGVTEWTTVSNMTSPHTVAGLSANTTYEFQAQKTNSSGTSPWSTAKFATTSITQQALNGKTVAFAAVNPAALDSVTEKPFVDRLGLLGYTVQVFDDSEIATRDHTGASAIVVSVDSVFPSSAKDLPYPILTMDGRDATTFGHAGTQTYDRYDGFDTATMLSGSTSGIGGTLTGNVRMYSAPGGTGTAVSLVAPAKGVASLANNTQFATIYATESGTKRTLYGYHQGTLLTGDGWTLFGNSVSWATS